MPDPISWAYSWPYYLAALGFGYLIGTIPFGLILTRIAGLGDIRKLGSGNIGATNVLRTGNRWLAGLTLAGDLLKGTVPVLIGYRFGPDPAIIAGFGAFLGHLFPVWLGFRGGKGIATYLGVLLGLYWPGVFVFAAVWLMMAGAFRYSSLAALAATLAVPAFLFATDEIQIGQLFALMSAIAWVKHHTNIRRLISGTESKIGRKS